MPDVQRAALVFLLPPGTPEGDEQQRFYQVLRQLRVFDADSADGDYEAQLRVEVRCRRELRSAGGWLRGASKARA